MEMLILMLRVLLAGGVFAASLTYMEKRRILRGWVAAVFCGISGLAANLLSDALLYRGAGFSSHPFLAVLAALAMAALLASAVSALGCLLRAVCFRNLKVSRRKRKGFSSAIPQQRVGRAA